MESSVEIAPKGRQNASFDSFKLRWTNHKTLDSSKRGHTGVYCDYESSDWNYRQFIDWLGRHLPSFALSPKELKDLGDDNIVDKLERAAGQLYDRSNETELRGEIGELILHGLIKDIYGTTPLVSKVYYKTAPGDTVKGADCVHAIIDDQNEIESLWLGEAKFYKNSTDGIRAAVSSVTDFMGRLAARQEFVTIRHHLDSDDPIGQKAEALLANSVSLDDIKTKICIPVLVTYESAATQANTLHSDEFVEELRSEMQPLIASFLEKVSSITEVDIHVFMMPLKSKGELIRKVDAFIEGKRSIFS